MVRRALARARGTRAVRPGPGPRGRGARGARAGGLEGRVRCRLPGPRSLILRSLARGSLALQPAKPAGRSRGRGRRASGPGRGWVSVCPAACTARPGATPALTSGTCRQERTSLAWPFPPPPAYRVTQRAHHSRTHTRPTRPCPHPRASSAAGRPKRS